MRRTGQGAEQCEKREASDHLSNFEVIEVNTMVEDSKLSPDRKSDTWMVITVFLGDLSDFEVIEVNTIVEDSKRSLFKPQSPPNCIDESRRHFHPEFCLDLVR
jgi:hypothetical protein